jgi:uncharacterized protein YgiM (DUF1202 family)
MISPMRWRSILLALFLAASSLAFAQEQAFTNRSTELMDKASTDGKVVATLKADTPVKVVQRSGGWTKIDANGQQGYVRAFHLRFPAAVETSSSSGGVLGGLTGGLFGSKSQPKSATVATTGIRGLSAEDFKNANPDPAALAKMESFRVDKSAAQSFAREAKLSSVSINYLMEEATSGRRR